MIPEPRKNSTRAALSAILSAILLALIVVGPARTSAPTSAPASAPAAYQITGVSDLVVYPYLRPREHQGATGINERDQVVGVRGLQGFVWEKGVRTDIGFLPDDPRSTANAINERGQVVGGSGDFGPIVLSGLYMCAAYLWERGKMRRLVPERWGASFEPFDINDRGMVVGRREFRGFTLKGKAFAVVPTLSTWPGSAVGDGGDANVSSVRAVNNRGVFAGATTVNDPKAPPYELPVHAFVWVPGKNGGGRLKDLGTLLGYRHSAASDINERGDVIGVVGKNAWIESVADRPVLWRGGKVIVLGLLPGAASGRAHAINDPGWIVGSSGGRAVLWQAQRPQRALDLNALLAPDSGWVLESATAINNRGWIAGRGTKDGKPWLFLLTPAVVSR